MWLQSSAVSFKFFFQWITEESYRFPDTNPEKLLQREKWSSVWDHGVYIFFSSHCRILKFDISDSSSVWSGLCIFCKQPKASRVRRTKLAWSCLIFLLQGVQHSPMKILRASTGRNRVGRALTRALWMNLELISENVHCAAEKVISLFLCSQKRSLYRYVFLLDIPTWNLDQISSDGGYSFCEGVETTLL